jgi:hypothetical protein
LTGPFHPGPSFARSSQRSFAASVSSSPCSEISPPSGADWTPLVPAWPYWPERPRHSRQRSSFNVAPATTYRSSSSEDVPRDAAIRVECQRAPLPEDVGGCAVAE